MAAIINHWFTASITLHNVLHSFWNSRGTCTASLESKLLQKFEDMREEVMYSIFLDLHKLYDALDRDICLEILEGYGMEIWYHHILWGYWYKI